MIFACVWHVFILDFMYVSCPYALSTLWNLHFKMFTVLWSALETFYCAYDPHFKPILCLWPALLDFSVLMICTLRLCCALWLLLVYDMFYIWLLLMTLTMYCCSLISSPCILSCPNALALYCTLACFVLLCRVIWHVYARFPWPCLCPLCTSTFQHLQLLCSLLLMFCDDSNTWFFFLACLSWKCCTIVSLLATVLSSMYSCMCFELHVM